MQHILYYGPYWIYKGLTHFRQPFQKSNSFSGISCLIETNQLISFREFAFALLDFLLEEFSNQNKYDLFVNFHNGSEISEIFYGNSNKEAHFP